MQGWIALFRSLGDSLFEVVRAELAALQDDFGRSGRHLGVALALLGGAAVLGFWILGLLLFTLIAVVDIWLPLWASGLTVLVLFALAAAILAKLGLNRLRQVENPAETVRRHVDDHLTWWQSNLLAEPVAVEAAPAGPAPGEELP